MLAALDDRWKGDIYEAQSPLGNWVCAVRLTKGEKVWSVRPIFVGPQIDRYMVSVQTVKDGMTMRISAPTMMDAIKKTLDAVRVKRAEATELLEMRPLAGPKIT